MEIIEDDKKVNKEKNNNLHNKINVNYSDKNSNAESKNSNDDQRIKLVLKYLDISQEFPIFKQNNIKFNDLLLLTRADLIELNFALVERNRLLNFSKYYLKYANTFTTEEINNFFSEYKILNISLTNTNVSNKKNRRLNTVENDNLIKSNFLDKKIKLKTSKNDDEFNNNEYQNLCSFTNKHVKNRNNNNNYRDSKNNIFTEDNTIVYNGGINKNWNNNYKNFNRYSNYVEKEKNKNTMSIEKFDFGFPSLKKNNKNNNKKKINSQRVLTIRTNKAKSSNNFFNRFNKLSVEINDYFKNMGKQSKKNEIKNINKFELKEKEKNKKKIEKNQNNIRKLKENLQKIRISTTKEKDERINPINSIKKNKSVSNEKIEKLNQLRKHKEDLKNQLMNLYDKNSEIKSIIRYMDEVDD